MPVIRHTPEQRAEYAKNPASLGLPLQTLRGQFSEAAPPEEKTTASFDLGPMSATERARGGDYWKAGAFIGDAKTGVLKGLAFIPDVILNQIMRATEASSGLPKGTYTRDQVKRRVAAGNYEDADWLVPGLIGHGKSEELGTGSKFGNTVQFASEFATLAHPFAKMLNLMAKGSKATQAALAGKTAFRSTPEVAGSGGVRMAVPTSPVDPLTGRAVGIGFEPTTTMGKFGDMMIANYRKRPAGKWGVRGAGAAEMGYGGASGAGFGIDQEYFGGSGLVGGLVAPLAAPFILSAGKGITKYFPTQYLYRNIKGGRDDLGVAGRVAGGGNEAVAREAASAEARAMVKTEIERQMATPEWAENVKSIEGINRELGHYFPDNVVPLNISQQLMNPESTWRGRGALIIGGRPAIQTHEETSNQIIEAMQKYWNDKLAHGVQVGIDPSPLFIFDNIRNKYSTTLTGLTDETGKALSELETLVPGYTQAQRYGVGEDMRAQIEAARKQAMNTAEDRARTRGINDEGVGDVLGSRQDFEDFATETRKAFLPILEKDSLTWETLSPEIKRIINAVDDPDYRVSLFDWKNFRQDLTHGISNAYNAGDNAGAARLKTMADMWDTFGTQTSAALARNPQAGRSNANDIIDYINWYKNQVAGPFENRFFVTTTRRAGGTDAMPLYQTGGENVAGQFINSVEGVRAFKNIFGENGLAANPAAMKNLENAFFDKAYIEVYGGKGAFDKSKWDAFRNRNDQIIEDLNLTQAFDDVRLAEQNISSRAAKLTERSEAVKRNRLFRLLNNKLAGEGDPDTVMDALFTYGKRGELAEMRSAAAAEGLEKEWNRVVLDRIVRKAFKSPDANFSKDPGALKRWLDNKQNLALLDNAMGKEHVNNIWLLADLGERVNLLLPRDKNNDVVWSALKGMDTTGLINKMEQVTGTSVPSATSRFAAIQERRFSPRWAMMYLGTRALARGQSARYDAVLSEALTNPKFANEILKVPSRELIPDGQIGLPLAGPRDTLLDFFWRRGIPASAILGAQYLKGNMEPEETDLNLGAVSESILPPRTPDSDFQYVNPTFPSVNPRPRANPPTSGFAGGPPPPTGIAAAGQPEEEITETTSFSELFPFDPTGQAISNRRTQGGGGGGGGIGSLI